jgi:hypothetical protein
MEAPGGTGIVKTALQTQEFVKPVVENLIQVLSQVESVGNLIYTRALLKQKAKSGDLRRPGSPFTQNEET